MNTATERTLIELNNRFYREHADTFSATRQAPWPGWERLMDLAAERIGAQSAPVILDLACGNLRFERFCLERLGEAAAVFHAVDASAELAALAPSIPGAHCWQVDLLDELQAGRDPLPGLAPAHFTVCFGFLHHVPGARLRGELLDLMAHTTAPAASSRCRFGASWTTRASPRRRRRPTRSQRPPGCRMPSSIPVIIISVGKMTRAPYAFAIISMTRKSTRAHSTSRAQAPLKSLATMPMAAAARSTATSCFARTDRDTASVHIPRISSEAPDLRLQSSHTKTRTAPQRPR